ncbi:NUDIX domain-containing protein [Tabrizicola aquatica]|uniref:NUDIX domain-containing protein n=1 Tax=Tabrizicola aquatica TaxID=909926 RepID=UPI002481BC6C|nr:NUDIX domain-containing protein [Tabrizicola aquatica]
MQDASGALRDIVLGPPGSDHAARLAHYAQVTGQEVPGNPGAWVPASAGPEAEALAQLVMEAYPAVPAAVLRRRLGSLRVAAASRVRAAGSTAPLLRAGGGAVDVLARQHPHAGFFALEALELSHPRFDGGRSPRLHREVFVAGDAVTVLPYDPIRDRVLLIEQFRMGPFGRGDAHPWQLEAIAGRIDPGETPEDAARREAVEEAGLVLGALEKVAEYYPTPGAVTEYLYSYVAFCDLPDGVAGVFGAAEEAEDIKGHLVSFDRLLDVVAAGEIGNAPLLLTVLWLQRERPRLRG